MTRLSEADQRTVDECPECDGTGRWQGWICGDCDGTGRRDARPSDEDRVARAICIADGHDPDADWRDVGPITLDVAIREEDRPYWTRYRKHARAAIAALQQAEE